jgi:hypothetical protein
MRERRTTVIKKNRAKGRKKEGTTKFGGYFGYG